MKVLFFLTLSVLCFGQKKDTLRLEPFVKIELPKKLHEASGIVRKDGKFWLLNDSGNEPCLYALEKKKILEEKCLPVKNIDWEALTVDPNGNLYIGDIGNRPGQDRFFSIYKLNPSGQILTYTYRYPEQNKPGLKEGEFDAEALFYDENGLQLLSKSWKTYFLRRYLVQPGEEKDLIKKEEIKLDYLVTDASFYGENLYTVGYNPQGQVFLSRFSRDPEGKYFSSLSRSAFLGLSVWVGQVEGIFADAQGLWIASERFKSFLGTVPPRLYHLRWTDLPAGWSAQ